MSSWDGIDVNSPTATSYAISTLLSSKWADARAAATRALQDDEKTSVGASEKAKHFVEVASHRSLSTVVAEVWYA